ncbi:MAG: alpha/beta hydrolase-fold protein, partial [Bacteroidota bacterium]
PIPQLNRQRTVRVLLPRNYHTHPERRFPVIYLHDGQNLFDANASSFGAWKLSRQMARQPLYRQAILVGIDHGGIDRMHEYAPFKRGQHGGQGDAYLKFVAETLKPFIDQHYRSWPQRDATGMVGSSMGGLITFYAAMRYNHVFGKFGVLSPSLWFNPGVAKLLEKQQVKNSQIYLGGSRTEMGSMGPALEQLYWKFQAAGYDDEKVRVVIRDRGRHNETFWGREFKPMFEWLFERTVWE